MPFRGGEPAGGYETLVNPGRPIPAASTRIHGITDDDGELAAPRLDEVLDELEALLRRPRRRAAHGVAFDLAILDRAAPRPPAAAARKRRPLHDAARCRPPSRLGGRDPRVVASRLGVPVIGRHTARGDAVIAGAVMVELVPELPGGVTAPSRDALWLQGRVLL